MNARLKDKSSTDALQSSRISRLQVAHVLKVFGSAVLIAGLCGMLCACGGTSGKGSSSSQRGQTPLTDYTAVYATYHPEAASMSDDGVAGIDASAVAEGYVAACCTNGAKLKFQIIHGDTTYNFDLASDGTAEVYPLVSGNGSYTFRIMQNTEGDKYFELFATTVDVTMPDDFQPFLRNSQMCNYSADSNCVQMANGFRAKSTTELDLVTNIYDYITNNIKYDTQKAATVQNGYVPNPDATIASGKAICFDYASLAAAMMRSQGIPCKIVTGYVDPENIYHAWNIIYFQDTGWVSVEIAVENGQWKRIDMTMAASEGDSGANGDKRTYTDRFVY